MKLKLIAHVIYRCLFMPSTDGPFPFISLKKHCFLSKLWFRYLTKSHYFGQYCFYQSLESLGLPGIRPSLKRYEDYNLKKLLDKDDRVLDIGCNLGFFDITIAPYVKFIDAHDINKELVDIGGSASHYLNINNVNFSALDFKKLVIENKYDKVFCFAVHNWIGMSFEDFVDKVRSLLKPGGVVVFESNNYDRTKDDFDDEVNFFVSNGFEMIYDGLSYYETKRRYVCLRKH